MDRYLKDKGIDTVWFAVAEDLNTAFEQVYSDALAQAGLDGAVLLQIAGRSLYQKNKESFAEVAAGTIGKTGAELDSLLVAREQRELELYIKAEHPNGPTSAARMQVDFALSSEVMAVAPLFGGASGRLASALSVVRSRLGEFDFWNVEHRIALGEEMVTQRRRMENR
jgi:hypothetical protein